MAAAAGGLDVAAAAGGLDMAAAAGGLSSSSCVVVEVQDQRATASLQRLLLHNGYILSQKSREKEILIKIVNYTYLCTFRILIFYSSSPLIRNSKSVRRH